MEDGEPQELQTSGIDIKLERYKFPGLFIS